MSTAWEGVLLVLALIPLVALLVWAVTDLVRRNDITAVRKIVWIVAVVAIPLLGPALYLVFRPRRTSDIRGFGGRSRRRGGGHSDDSPPP